MMRWGLRLLLLAVTVSALRRLFGLFDPARHATSADALVAGGELVEVDGCRLHFERRGSGPPVIFIHGFLGSAGVWGALAERLDPFFTTYALDLPGSGLSDKPGDRAYDCTEHAGTVAAFAEQKCAEPVWLMSTSAGARVALAAATAQPDRFPGIALLGPALELEPPRLSPQWIGRTAAMITAALRSRRLVGGALRMSTGPGMRVDDTLIDAFMIPARTEGFAGALATSLAARNGTRREDFSDAGNLPVLIVRGLDDRIAPAEDAEWLRTRTGGELHLLPGCGHLPENERPDEIAALFRGFVENHSPAEAR